MFAASSRLSALGVRAAIHHDADQFWLNRLCRASSCRLVILVGLLPWVLLPNSFSMFRRSMVKANAGQKNQHACIQNHNDQLWWIVPLCQNAWWHIGSEAPKIKQHAFMAGQKNQHTFVASQHALQCWGGHGARPPLLKTKCDYKKCFKLLCATTKRSL